MNFLPEQTQHVEEDIGDRSKEAWAFRHAVPGQAYALLCIVSPGGTRQTSQMEESAIKIFGCFPTLDSPTQRPPRFRSNATFLTSTSAARTTGSPCPRITRASKT